MSEAGTKVINALRHKFNMDDPGDIEVWEELNKINRESYELVLKAFYNELKWELADLEEHIEMFEKIRVKNLRNAERRKKCNEILSVLKKERDELKRTVESKAHKRLAA